MHNDEILLGVNITGAIRNTRGYCQILPSH